MSLELYWTRLIWDGSRGVAKCGGRVVQLDTAPTIGGDPVEGIDHAPEVHCFQILPLRGGWREMTAAEISDCQTLLQRLTRPAA